MLHFQSKSIILHPSRRRYSWRPGQVDGDVRSLHLRNESSGRDQGRLGGEVQGRLRRNVPRPVDRRRLPHFIRLVICLFEGLRGRSLSSEGDNILPANNDESEGTFDLFLHSGFVGLGDSVLFGIGEYDVHVLVEGEEGADHHAAVLDGEPDSEVDPLQKLAPLGGHLYQIYNRLWIYQTISEQASKYQHGF